MDPSAANFDCITIELENLKATEDQHESANNGRGNCLLKAVG